jgi:RHS repeat-associated protein
MFADMNNITQNSKEQDYESRLADHGVRKYDYDIGRFTSTDVLFEKYYGWSPYQYSANNPLYYSLSFGEGRGEV